jgi:G6PDH family F420-dependent oxidoreductase
MLAMRIGYFLSTEEYTPAQLIEQARLAEEAGFAGLWISDHFHPWNDDQGQSPFVWSMIGALSQVTSLPITTAVTCPIMRIHPAIIAQAAATSAVLTEGRFVLGVGSGEALNEHILGDHWPIASTRLEMLEEAVELIRRLWTGESVDHEGPYYAVENARIYTLPEQPPKIYVSGFGPKATDVAARIGDGYVSTKPDAEMVQRFREAAGPGKPAVAGTKGCFAPTRDEAVETAHRLWRTSGLPGELAQILPTPAHFEQAAQLVTQEMTAEAMPCGPDPKPHIDGLRAYLDAGYDEVHVASVGPHYREFIRLYRDEVVPALS